jgi:glycosyltransferase involved in cell wall biosynthesis
VLGDEVRARGVVFVLPCRTSGQRGPVAAWLSTAGWASAARRVIGASWITTPNGLVTPGEARSRASRPQLSTPSTSWWRQKVPTVAKTAAKDLRQWGRARKFAIDVDGPWSDHDIPFVWQRHELFHLGGLDLARRLGVPSVLFVPAPLVWESAQWAVTRPGWSSWLERFGERPSLLAADLVACGSDMVAEQVHRLGVREEQILVTPTGVDLDLFADAPDRQAMRQRLHLEDRFVVGWAGSFRRFHALEQAIDAVSDIDDATLLLVGDGPERIRIRRMARERGISVKFTGTVPHGELPRYLAAMDVGLVLASPDQAFHYSPLKLAEYLAAGLPVVAPRVSQLADRLSDGEDVVFVPPGDPGALGKNLRKLRDDDEYRTRIATAARASAEARWSWDNEVRRVLDALR